MKGVKPVKVIVPRRVFPSGLEQELEIESPAINPFDQLETFTLCIVSSGTKINCCDVEDSEMKRIVGTFLIYSCKSSSRIDSTDFYRKELNPVFECGHLPHLLLVELRAGRTERAAPKGVNVWATPCGVVYLAGCGFANSIAVPPELTVLEDAPAQAYLDRLEELGVDTPNLSARLELLFGLYPFGCAAEWNRVERVL